MNKSLIAGLAGIALFGVLGFIVGPILTAFLVTMLEIYGTEFRSQLSFEGHGPDPDEGNGAAPDNDQSAIDVDADAPQDG